MALCLAAALVALAAAPGMAAQAAVATPLITFTKTLKGRSPEYMAVSVDANGKGTYQSHKLGESGTPRPLQLSPETARQIFSLAESLNNFRGIELDSRHKVANMGLKTLTYAAGTQTDRVQYNYSENRDARQLTGIFEKIGNVEEHITNLEYEMRFDPLSLPQTLAQIQDDMANHNLAGPALLVPTLEKISQNPRFLHLAKARADEIMQAIQTRK